jgi:hypothetical protein
MMTLWMTEDDTDYSLLKGRLLIILLKKVRSPLSKKDGMEYRMDSTPLSGFTLSTISLFEASNLTQRPTTNNPAHPINV